MVNFYVFHVLCAIIGHLFETTFKDTNEKMWWYRCIKELVLKNKETVLSHHKISKIFKSCYQRLDVVWR